MIKNLIVGFFVLLGVSSCARYAPPESGPTAKITFSIATPKGVQLDFESRAGGSVSICQKGKEKSTGKQLIGSLTAIALIGEVDQFDLSVPADEKIGVKFTDKRTYGSYTEVCEPAIAFYPTENSHYFITGERSLGYCKLNVLEKKGEDWQPMNNIKHVKNCSFVD